MPESRGGGRSGGGEWPSGGAGGQSLSWRTEGAEEEEGSSCNGADVLDVDLRDRWSSSYQTIEQPPHPPHCSTSV